MTTANQEGPAARLHATAPRKYPPVTPMPLEGRLVSADFEAGILEIKAPFQEVAAGTVLIVAADLVYRVAPALADALVGMRDAYCLNACEAVSPDAERGHVSECEEARMVLRSAGKLP